MTQPTTPVDDARAATERFFSALFAGGSVDASVKTSTTVTHESGLRSAATFLVTVLAVVALVLAPPVVIAVWRVLL